MPETLPTLTEFFVGLAGFSAVIVALAGARFTAVPIDRFRVLGLLYTTLGGALLSVTPGVLADAGLAPAAIWPVSSGLFAAFGVTLTVWSLRQRAGMALSVRRHLSRAVWVFGTGGAALLALTHALNALGWPAPPSSRLHAPSLVYLLVLGSILFIRMLTNRPYDEDGSEP